MGRRAAAGPGHRLRRDRRADHPHHPGDPADPSPDGRELVADLISRPPVWTVRLAGPGPTNVEGVAFTWGGHDLNLLAENRDVFVPAGAYER